MKTPQTLAHAAAVQVEAAMWHARLTALIQHALANVGLARQPMPGYATLITPPGLQAFARETDACLEHCRALANGLKVVWTWSIAHNAPAETLTYGHALNLQAPPGPGQAALDLSRLQKDTDEKAAHPWTFTIPASGHTAFAANRDHLIAAIAPESPEHGTARSALVAKLQALQDFGETAILKDDEAWLCIAAILAVAKSPYAPPTGASP